MIRIFYIKFFDIIPSKNEQHLIIPLSLLPLVHPLLTPDKKGFYDFQHCLIINPVHFFDEKYVNIAEAEV